MATPTPTLKSMSLDGGALRVAGRCKRGEKRLSWNQIGPAGVNGGAGLQGLVGPTGPSDVYADGRAAGTFPPAPQYISLASVSVPAGSYLIEAKVTYDGGEKQRIECWLADNVKLLEVWDKAAASGGPGGSEKTPTSVVSLAAAQKFAGPRPIELVCAGSGNVENAHLLAIKIGSLHGKLPAQ
jgi:hypothetical protein